MKNEPGIEIVKMDATANDVPPAFSVSGYSFTCVYFSYHLSQHFLIIVKIPDHILGSER